MVNICVDYDNSAQDKLYISDTVKEVVTWVDDEILEYLIEQCNNDITRLRYFIGDTYGADIYKLDVYGNLENVDMNDIIECIDEAIELLK